MSWNGATLTWFKKENEVSNMGFKKSVFYRSSDYTKRGRNQKVTGYAISLDGIKTLIISTSNPRQYVEIPWSLIEKIEDDLVGQELQAARGRREDWIEKHS